MNKTHLILIPALLAALSGCSRHDADEQGHDHAEHGAHDNHADAGHAAHDELPGQAVTHFSPATELFVEFPSLVRGEEAAFAAHLTRLADFKAVNAGTLTVRLSGGGQPDEQVVANVSKTAGIFRPTIKPQYAGKRHMVFVLAAPGLNATHDLGEVQVFSDAKSARAAAQEEPADNSIKFTKELQWNMDFQLHSVTAHTLRESLAVNASVRPRPQAEAHISAPAGGLFRASAKGLPQVGERVQAGQLLGYLAPKLGGDTDVATLELALQRSRIELDQARDERIRLEKLFAAEAVPEKRVREARNAERLAQAEWQAAVQRQAALQGGASGIPLKAPVSGVVLAVNVAQGAAVNEGQLLLHIADLSRLRIDAHVPENMLGRVVQPTGLFLLQDGDTTPLRFEIGKNARLEAFSGMVDPDSRTAAAMFDVDNASQRLRAGMNLRAYLYTGKQLQGLVVPASAVIDENGQSVVYVQQDGEAFVRRVVETGIRDGDWIAIRGGLQAQERVVSKGAYQVRLAASAPAALGHGHAH